MVTLTSSEKNEVVYVYLQECGYESAYIGLTDREEEGHWCWITGEAVDYSNWNKEEPNDNENENYAMFFTSFLMRAGVTDLSAKINMTVVEHLSVNGNKD